MKGYLILKEVFLVFISVLGLSMASQMSYDLPVGNVIPITGQSFAVLIIGYFLPWKLSLVSVLIYMVGGVVGLPLFADSSSGLDILAGKSGGYIIGFLPAAVLISKWEYAKRNILSHTLQTFIFATGIILVIGVGRLSLDVGLSLAIEYGLKPFWIGAIIKVLLALGVVYLYLKYLDNNSKSNLIDSSESSRNVSAE